MNYKKLLINYLLVMVLLMPLGAQEGEAKKVLSEPKDEKSTDAQDKEKKWKASFSFNTEIDVTLAGGDSSILSYKGLASDLTVLAGFSKAVTDKTDLSINLMDLLFYSENKGLALDSNQFYFGLSATTQLDENVSLTAGGDLMIGYNPSSPVYAGFDSYYQLDWSFKGLTSSFYHNLELGVNADNSGLYLLNWLIYDFRYDFSSLNSVNTKLGLFFSGESILTSNFTKASNGFDADGTTIWHDFYSGFFANPLDFFALDFGLNVISNFNLSNQSVINSVAAINKIGGRVGTHFSKDWFDISVAFMPLWVQGTSNYETNVEVMVDIAL